MRKDTAEWQSYSLNDLQSIAAESNRLGKSELLEKYLIAKGYTKTGDDLYHLNSPEQLIKLEKSEEGITYQNLLMENDAGKFIDFIMHRLPDERYIREVSMDNVLSLFPSAVAVGLHFEKTGKAIPLKPEIKPALRRKPTKRKGRRI